MRRRLAGPVTEHVVWKPVAHVNHHAWQPKQIQLSITVMVLILEVTLGNSERGAHVKRNLFYLKWLRHLIRSRTNRVFPAEITYISSCVRNMF